MLDPSQNGTPRALSSNGRHLESSLGGAAAKPVRLSGTTATQDPGAHLMSQYRNRVHGSMDAASFGKHMPLDEILAELARKYKRNMSSRWILKDDGTVKQLNPNVQKAVHHVCLFLSARGINPGY